LPTSTTRNANTGSTAIIWQGEDAEGNLNIYYADGTQRTIKGYNPTKAAAAGGMTDAEKLQYQLAQDRFLWEKDQAKIQADLERERYLTS